MLRFFVAQYKDFTIMAPPRSDKRDRSDRSGRSDRSDRGDRFEKEPFVPKKRKWIPIFEGDSNNIDFKDMRLLLRFVTERGKILPRRITSLSAQQQRKMTNAIKRARQMGYMPFINYGGSEARFEPRFEPRF